MAPTLRPRKRLNQSPAQQANRMNVQNISSRWGKQQDQPHSSRGFRNWTGSVCYFSSVLQALLHIPKFVNWLEFEHRICTANSTRRGICVACALRTLSTLYWDSNSEQSDIDKAVKKIFQRLRIAGWTDGGQQDAHELYLYLIDTLQTELPSAAAVIGALFQCTQCDTLICPACNDQSPILATHSSIGITYEKAASLVELFRSEGGLGTVFNLSSPCSACTSASDRSCRKRIVTPPEILVVQIRRFLNDKKGNVQVRHDHIPFAERLDLSPFIDGPSALNYRLVAVANHRGKLGSGHYITVARGPSGKWEEMNDSGVRTVRLRDALRPAESWSPYMLFYERVGGEIVEAPTKAYDPAFWEEEDRKRGVATIKRTKKKKDGVRKTPKGLSLKRTQVQKRT